MENSALKAALGAKMDEATLDQEARDAIARLDESDLLQIDRAILSALGRDWK